MQEDHEAIEKVCSQNIVIPLYCICLLPESYDKEMIQCDVCGKWYVTAAPESWTCFEFHLVLYILYLYLELHYIHNYIFVAL